MGRIKYTRDKLAAAAAASTSVLGVMQALGINTASGGSHGHVSSQLRRFGIDTSHFIRHHRGPRPPRQKAVGHVLVLRASGRRTTAFRLRRALLSIGREYVCECCGTGPFWNGKELRLQVDHKNGNHLDDRAENLRFICPNCHTQTDNYCNNKGMTGLVTRASCKRKRPEVV